MRISDLIQRKRRQLCTIGETDTAVMDTAIRDTAEMDTAIRDTAEAADAAGKNRMIPAGGD